MAAGGLARTASSRRSQDSAFCRDIRVFRCKTVEHGFGLCGATSAKIIENALNRRIQLAQRSRIFLFAVLGPRLTSIWQLMPLAAKYSYGIPASATPSPNIRSRSAEHTSELQSL